MPVRLVRLGNCIEVKHRHIEYRLLEELYSVHIATFFGGRLFSLQFSSQVSHRVEKRKYKGGEKHRR